MKKSQLGSRDLDSLNRDPNIDPEDDENLDPVSESDKLAEKLLHDLIPALGADRGCLVLLRGSSPQTVAQLGMDNSLDDSEADPEVLREVLERRIPVLTTHPRDSSASRSVLCVPLLRGERALGAIYLESSTGSGFRHADQEMATGAALGAALAFAPHWKVVKEPTDSPAPGQSRGNPKSPASHGMVGESSKLREALHILERVAPTHSTILIRGESGTGKELAARAIHQASSRASGPFVAINCSTLSENLLESELFGHEKGAFTGAVCHKVGKLEAAAGGTLFLDEMGEIPLGVQAKLLRVLQEWVFERVGSTRSIQADLRLVTATNRDLEAAIRDGQLRQDLYYRLNVITVVMPALRDRREDIEPLAHYFAAEQGARLGRKVTGLSPEAMNRLRRYHWPGNVRELANVIERAVVLIDGELIEASALPEEIFGSSDDDQSTSQEYHSVLAATKKALIRNAVRRADGNYMRAANKLGIHINSLYRLIRILDLKEDLEA